MSLPKIINDKLLIGRDEWFALPDLSIPKIKGKIDTGAKTSAIHAFNIRCEVIKGVKMVLFDVYPEQASEEISVSCMAPIVDQRAITSSNGHREDRYVIETTLSLADESWLIQVTLSNRDPLRYRMLIGREALSNRVLIDPHLSCHQSKPSKKKKR